MELVATPLANPFPPAQTGSKLQFVPFAGRPSGLLRLWHLASLDAPTVAIVWAWAFAWSAHIHLAAWPLVLLGLVVWTVYIADRLLDAQAGRRNPADHDLRARHHFHWRHRRILAPLAGVAALVAAAIVRRRVPVIALPQDSAVAIATLAYFSGVHGRLKLPGTLERLARAIGSRECLVGALFAAGCVLPAWSVDPASWGPASPLRLLVVPAIYFAALAWLNLRAITRWESGLRLGGITWALSGAGLLLAASLAAGQPRAAALVTAAAVSALLIGWLDSKSARLEPVTLRAAVDLVLLSPLLLVAIR
jgi:hypothetical protein